MDEGKKIDLQQYVRPKASNKYLWRILYYCLLLGGLTAFIFYVLEDGKPQPAKAKKPKVEQVDEISDFTIED